MILVDVNVLVYAHREDAQNHPAYKAWLLRVLDGPEPFAYSEAVLSGFLRLVTHPRIFNPPTPSQQAWAFASALRDHPLAVRLSPGVRNWELFQDLCRQNEVRGNLLADAWHAALAIEYGCEWITTDRDFARFKGLRWRHPLNEG